MSKSKSEDQKNKLTEFVTSKKLKTMLNQKNI